MSASGKGGGGETGHNLETRGGWRRWREGHPPVGLGRPTHVAGKVGVNGSGRVAQNVSGESGEGRLVCDCRGAGVQRYGATCLFPDLGTSVPRAAGSIATHPTLAGVEGAATKPMSLLVHTRGFSSIGNALQEAP